LILAESCSVNDVGDGRKRVVADGSTVDLAGELDFSRPATSLVEVGFPGEMQQFGVGTIGFGEWSAREVGVVAFDQEYAYQGGRFRIGSAVITDDFTRVQTLAHMGVWEGSNFSVKTQQLGGEPTALISLFEQIAIVERELGVELQPKLSGVEVKRTGSFVPRVLKLVPGLGIVTVRQLSEELVSGLPEWNGYPAAGGELFVLGEGEGATLVLVGDSAFTSIVPDASSLESAVLAGAMGLVAKWTPPVS